MTFSFKWAAAIALGGLASVGAAVGYWSRFVHPYRTQLTHEIMAVPRKHARLNGLTIAFVSDTHIGPHFRTDDLRPAIEMLRRAQPDILLLGGDYVSESPRFIDPSVDALLDMAATARFGTWAILGNHDLANTPERVVEALERAGIPTLINDAAHAETDRGDLWIVGIDDALLGEPDLKAAFSGIPADAPVVAMWHEPDVAEDMLPFDPLFMLSGHTHGGQIRIPGLVDAAVPRLGKRYPLGRYEVQGMPLYVSSGVGMYRPPVRFNCPPEVVIITLLGEQDGADMLSSQLPARGTLRAEM
ncbi:MAG TPA: metallophosphoesterase [Thermomicrobiales bacterium]|nr:metallophosphoesterase [Thermomicrobiales bacterium]